MKLKELDPPPLDPLPPDPNTPGTAFGAELPLPPNGPDTEPDDEVVPRAGTLDLLAPKGPVTELVEPVDPRDGLLPPKGPDTAGLESVEALL